MRLLILPLTLALPLAACGKNDGEAQNRDGSGMTADSISSNDITAIDAVTGEAANMAADVDFNANAANALENAAGNEVASTSSTGSARARPKPATSAPAPTSAPPTTEQPTANTTE